MPTTRDAPAARAAEFRRLTEKLWGYGALTRAAEHFDVAGRTTRHWAAGSRGVPDAILDELRAMVSIGPPPDTGPEHDRDEACRQAVEPALTDLRNRAVGAGWHPAEVAAAILSLVVSEIAHHAGGAAARGILAEAAEILAAE